MDKSVVSQMPSHAAAAKMRAAGAGYNFARRVDQVKHDYQHGYDGHYDDYEHHHSDYYDDDCSPCASPCARRVIPPYDDCGGCGKCSKCIRGYTSGCDYGNTCAFPQPPPRRCYCMPAAFSSTCGQTHHRLLDAYGSSRPC